MKRLLNHILALVLASMFLVSFTGIRLLVHHCMSCDTVDVIFASYSGDDCNDIHLRHKLMVHEQGEGQHGKSCCSGEQHHEASCSHSGNCCQTEELFIRNDEVVAHERIVYQLHPLEQMHTLPSETFLQPAGELTALTQGDTRSTDPPPKLTGRKFIIFSHQFKFC